jgi:hypothetical protein
MPHPLIFIVVKVTERELDVGAEQPGANHQHRDDPHRELRVHLRQRSGLVKVQRRRLEAGKSNKISRS